MKLPFSYREQFFTPLLTASVLGHAVFLSAGLAFWGSAPSYGVKLAPSSMEIVMVRQKPVEVQKASEEAITALESSHEIQRPERASKQEPVEEVLKDIVTPEDFGALYEETEQHLKNSPPVYPELARREGWEGLVVLQVMVSSAGEVGEIKVEKSSGYKILDRAAFRAIRDWKFSPRRMGPAVFSSKLRIPVRFTLVNKR